MRYLLAIACLVGLAPSVSAQSLTIDIDVSQAKRLLEIACSGAVIDEEEWTNLKPLQAQLAHHSQFGERFNFDNYIVGLNHLSQCKVPSSDPFRFAALVERQADMRMAIEYLSRNRDRLNARVTELLQPYVPPGFDFEGKVVLAGASFSCGGFQNSGVFFVDIPCLAADIDGEYDAISRLIAHETYHAMQNDFANPQSPDLELVRSVDSAHDFMFERLAIEGTASHIGDMREIDGDGRYANFSRSLARRNYRHLEYNFQLFDYMIEAIGTQPAEIEHRFPDIYGLAFDGSFGEHSYFVGQQMAAEIEHDFGAQAIPCLLKLPFENFLLAYDYALQDGSNLKKSSAFSDATLKVAADRKKARQSEHDFQPCIGAS
ncbi:MAG: DUF5700 domain-containing putative Zn-dependent protease [Erythrobacter sp.]